MIYPEYYWPRAYVFAEKLEPVEEYQVKLEAFNDMGFANEPVEVAEVLLGLQEPPQVSNFAFKEVINATCALVTWDPVDPVTFPGELQGFEIFFGFTDRSTYHRYLEVEPTASEAVICGLEPNKDNFANILAKNQGHSGPSTDLIKISMPQLEGLPDHNGGRVICHIHGSSSMVLFLSSVLPKPATVRGYNIYVTPLDAESSSTTKFQLTKGHYRLKINHLTPFTDYGIVVKPYNDMDVEGSPWMASFCTTGSKPEDPNKTDSRYVD